MTIDSPGMERRRYVRVSGPFGGRWRIGEYRHEAPVVGLSLGGCFIEALAPARTGDEIVVEVHASEGPIVLNGQIVYVDALRGFAVMFTDNAADAMRRLKEILGPAATSEAG